MNNPMIKLEDFELDEISGGISTDKTKAKQLAKKVGMYAVKGTSLLVFCIGGGIISLLLREKLKYRKNIYIFLNNKLKNKDIAGFITCDITAILPTAFSGVAGWKLGKWICKKIGLED